MKLGGKVQKIILLSSFFLASFSGALVVVSLLSHQIQKLEQETFTEKLLVTTEKVTSQIKSSLKNANEINNFQCNQEDLNHLRELVQSNSEIFDIGYIDNNLVKCTANWGVFKPVKLSAIDTSDKLGYRFYRNETNLYDINEPYNITSQNNFFVVNIANPLARHSNTMPNFEFKISTKDDSFVFDKYSPHTDSNSVFNLHLQTNVCSETYSYCVSTYNKHAGLGNYSEHVRMFIISTCAFLCYILTHVMNLVMETNRSIEYRFKKAIKNNSIYMEYQPLVCIDGDRIKAVEALVRWYDPVYGQVSPDLFISIAEKLSLYPELAYYTAKRSITDLAPTLRQIPSFDLGINIGSFEIREPEFLTFLDKLVGLERIRPNQIKIEITETIDVDIKTISNFADRAKSLGFKVVLDDFGTGVSNLVWLTEINFDYIKIDRVFVQALNFDPKKIMASAVMELVSNLDKPVVFEGVESSYEYKMIKKYCPQGYVQGWLFYKSMPLPELLDVLLKEYPDLLTSKTSELTGSFNEQTDT